MLFVAGALVLSYMLAFDRGHFLVWLWEVSEVVAEERDEAIFDANRWSQEVKESSWEDTVEQNEIVSLSQSLNTADEVQITSLSEVLESSEVGQWASVLDTPDAVVIDDKQFFSVQQLFAQWDSVDKYQQSTWLRMGTLDLQNTYVWQNNWKFVLPQAVWVDQEVQYILKDERNTHYVYLGDYMPLLFDEVTRVWWTAVAIEDDLSINRRWFFGDRVWMISLPAYEARNKIVLLVVFESDNDTWLLQIDRDRFEATGGTYLNESFAQHYIW